MNNLVECAEDGCLKPAMARGLCWMHYKRLQRSGDLIPGPTDSERFWSFVDKGGDCWTWNGWRRSRGLSYGAFKVHGETVASHRFAYELLKGPIPTGLHIDHLCRNTLCVNPDHLEPVTLAENTRRAKSLQTHCKQGHPFDGATGGQRVCSICRREAQRRFQDKRRAV